MSSKESISIEKYGLPYADLNEEQKKEVNGLYEEVQLKAMQKLKGVAE